MKITPSRATPLAALVALSCAGPGEPPGASRLAASSSEIGRVTYATDLDPDPDVLEVELRAEVTRVRLRAGGPQTEVWTYDGVLPGPVLEADVGDRLVVHFENALPAPTTIHFHGVDVPATMDGTPLSQRAVEPGETFTYDFPLLRPGIYWYHPHVTSARQVERGLYGALVVRDPDGEAGLDLPASEHVVVLDDALLEADNSIAPFDVADPVEWAQRQLNGREGDALLANGVEHPTVHVRAGQPQRLRLINASNSRFFRVSVPGHTLWVLGGQGGLAEAPRAAPPIESVAFTPHHGHASPCGHPHHPPSITERSDPDPDAGVLLTPGERADVVFVPHGRPGDRLVLEQHDFPRGRHVVERCDDGRLAVGHAPDDGLRAPAPLVTFALQGPPRPATWTPPEHLRAVPPIDVANAGSLPVTFGHGLPDPTTGDVTFFATMAGGMGVPFDAVTSTEALHVEVGRTYVWEVENLTGSDHNFHPHGFSFQHLETEYVDLDDPSASRVEPATTREVLDTIRVPARPGAMMRSRTIVRLAVRIDDAGRVGRIAAARKVPTPTSSGGWVVHCHLLEHAERGMMTFLEVAEPAP